MRNLASMLLIGSTLYLASCSKKEDVVKPDPASFRVKTILHNETGITETYTYTGDNKIQAINSSDGSKITYEYADSSLVETTYDDKGEVTGTRTMKLDEQGRATESNVTNSEGRVTAKHVITYDGAGHRTSETRYKPNGDINGKEEWAWGEDIYNYAIYDSAGLEKNYDTYYWYYDPTLTTITNENKGMTFMGKGEHFLTRHYHRYSWKFGDEVKKYKYTLDPQQRVSVVRTIDYAGTIINTDIYTYY